MNTFKIDARQLDNLDIQGLGSTLSGSPSARRATGMEATLLRGAVDLSGNVWAKEAISVADRKPRITAIGGAKYPIGLRPGTSPHLTMGLGISLAAAVVIGPTAGGGLYGSTTPEIGIYGSIGAGWWTNAFYSTGAAVTFVFGPPSDFAGIAWGIGADIKFIVGSLGGLLLFSPPPIRFLGFSVSLSAGPSAIPAFDVTIQVSNTWTKPLLV